MAEFINFLEYGGPPLYIVLLATLTLCLATWKRSAAYVMGGWVAVVLFALLASGVGMTQTMAQLVDNSVDAASRVGMFARGIARVTNVAGGLAFMAWIGGLVMTARAARESRGQTTVAWVAATPLVLIVPAALISDDLIEFILHGGNVMQVTPLFAALGAWMLARRPDAADADRDLWVGMAASLPTAALASLGHIFGNIAAFNMTASTDAVKKAQILAAESAHAMNNTIWAAALLFVGLLPLALAARALPARGPALVAGYATGVLIGFAGALFSGFGPFAVMLGAM